jgi:hypothetical protein
MNRKTSAGLVHDLTCDMNEAPTTDAAVTALCENMTPIARNEFICWVEDARLGKTH